MSSSRKLSEPAVQTFVAAPRKFLIVRLSALGDVIHTIPVACALRRHFPNAEIGWVVEGRNYELLEGHPAIDHLIRAPRRWLKSPRAVMQVRRALRARQFDVALDVQSLTKSAVAARLSGAPRRIGFGGRDGRELSTWFNREFAVASGTHVIERYLEILRPLGVKQPRVEFNLPEKPVEAEAIERKLAPLGLLRGFALLNVGAGWPSKIWPAERYGELARTLARRHGVPSIAVWGLPAERRLAEELVAASRGAAQLAPPTTVTELAALCRRAALFVGSDTGPLHLAVAIGARAVSLHGTSQAEVCGAYGPDNLRLQVRYHAGSARERRQADNSAIGEIGVEMVAEACEALLGRSDVRHIA